jgi:2-phospho-L-lactate transferase/gluconeogenesis factor (CofD/UPF0052 family)
MFKRSHDHSTDVLQALMLQAPDLQAVQSRALAMPAVTPMVTPMVTQAVQLKAQVPLPAACPVVLVCFYPIQTHTTLL